MVSLPPATSCLPSLSLFFTLLNLLHLSLLLAVWLWDVSPAAEDIQSKGGRYQKVQEIQQLQAELAGETKDSDIDFRT